MSKGLTRGDSGNACGRGGGASAGTVASSPPLSLGLRDMQHFIWFMPTASFNEGKIGETLQSKIYLFIYVAWAHLMKTEKESSPSLES